MNEITEPSTITKNEQHFDETFRLMNWWDADKVQAAKVLVVGAGALGNEVLKNLALMNVGNIFIIDFDVIEYANLARSIMFRESDSKEKKYKVEVIAQRVKELNPNVKVQWVNGDILTDVGLGVFRRMDAIIGCLDNRLARMWVNRYCFWMGKPWIDGGLGNMEGRVTVYSPKGYCFEGLLTANEKTMIEARYRCAARALRNLKEGKIPTTPLTSSVVGALQVIEALKLIHNYDDKMLYDKEFRFTALESEFMLYEKVLPEGDAINLSRETYSPLIEAKTLTNQSTFGEVLAWAKQNLKGKQPVITLHHPLILEIAHKEEAVSIVSNYLKLDEDFLIEKGWDYNDVLFTKRTQVINEDFEQLDITLEQAGIPPLHILQIADQETGEWNFVELTGDVTYLNFK